MSTRFFGGTAYGSETAGASGSTRPLRCCTNELIGTEVEVERLRNAEPGVGPGEEV